MSVTPERPGLLVAVTAVLFWAAVFVIAAEILLRWSCAYCSWSEQNNGDWKSPYTVESDSPYWLRKPGYTGSYNQPEFDYSLITNSLGLRDIEHPPTKAPGELRVVALGDSFTEGQGAPFEDTWPSVFSRKLNMAGDAYQYTVIIGGVAGSDPFYAYRLMVDRLLAYQPDLVLLTVNFSDVIDVVARGGEERFTRDGRTTGISDPPTGLPVWLFEHSHFTRFVMIELLDYTHLMMTKPERKEKVAVARKKIELLIVKLDRLLAQHGIRFALVVMPGANELRRGRYDDLHDLPALMEASKAASVSTIDVKPYLDAKLAEGDVQFGDLAWEIDRHYNPLGYRYFGEAVYEGLCGTDGVLQVDSEPRFCPRVREQ